MNNNRAFTKGINKKILCNFIETKGFIILTPYQSNDKLQPTPYAAPN